MPLLKMKAKLSTGCLREKNCLRVCQKSSVISKNTCSPVRISQQTAEFNICTEYYEDVSLRTEVSIPDIESSEYVDHKKLLDEENVQFQKEPSFFIASATMGRMESTHTCTSNLETIFSPVLEPIEVLGEPKFDKNEESSNDFDMPRLGTDDGDYNRISSDYQTCSVSDFYFSDMIIASLPFDENAVDNDITETNPLTDDKCADSSMLFDMAEQYMILPYLEGTIETSDANDVKSCKETMMHTDNAGLYLVIHQLSSHNQESDINSFSAPDQIECFDPHLFIKTLPEQSEVVSNFQPTILPKEAQGGKSITLVLDLDETLVHSTLEHCDGADFTFTVFFNMKEHTVYVKQRPYLRTFLERVAEMFEVVIFTASQSIYAEQLLDILDTDRKLISRRAYRESCIFSDGSYTKDLTILGIDLAKIAIIDNSPQVFQLQVNNGIPIKSWFDDLSDCALLSLLPFLETLVDADDVRPIIAKRFDSCRQCLYLCVLYSLLIGWLLWICWEVIEQIVRRIRFEIPHLVNLDIGQRSFENNNPGKITGM